MNTFRKFSFLAIVSLLLIVLAACGGNEKQSTSKQEGNESGDSTQEKSDDPVTIRWAHQWGKEEFDKDYGQSLIHI